MSRRKDESIFQLLFQALLQMPVWVGPLVAAVAYLGLRFVLPPILSHLSKPDDQMGKIVDTIGAGFCANIAPIVAAAVLVVWVVAECRKFAKRRQLDRQTGLGSIRALPWAEFEGLVAEAYRREGYQVEHTGDAAGDGGVDVVLRRDGQTTLVQCKHWKTWSVGEPVVRELLGVMTSRGADFGVVVTSGTFTSGATTFARDNRITLVNGSELVELIRSVQRSRPAAAAAAAAPGPRPAGEPPAAPTTASPDRTCASQPPSPAAPACPRCGAPMAQRTARRGPNAGSKFWGCSRYPGCQGTRPG